VGSLLLGGAADKFGRRITVIGCLLLMMLGMFMATTAHTPQVLSLWRVLTGFGIGGMLAATNALVHELSSKQGRSLATSAMVIGYPLGAFFGGLIAANLLKTHDWRVVFLFGGTMTALCLPLVLRYVPETPAWLQRTRRPDSLARINAALTRLGHRTLTSLAPATETETRASLADIFAPAHLKSTLLLAFGYAAHALTFYYILKMAPAIISDPDFAGQHFTRSQGAGVLAYANLGGAIGGAVFGWFMHKFGIKRATLVALLASSVLVVVFGFGHSTIMGWTLGVVMVGLFTNAAIVGFYAAFAASYPTYVKATGTGFALSIGRAGAALSPYLAGTLFKNHLGLMGVSAIMALGSLLSFALLLMLPIARDTD
jgi:MFS family permease